MADADRMLARRIVANAFHQDGSASYADVMAGGRDNDEAVAMAEAGIVLGRAMRDVVDPRLDLVVRSLVGNGVSRPVAPLFARDVLKALDAAS